MTPSAIASPIMLAAFSLPGTPRGYHSVSGPRALLILASYRPWSSLVWLSESSSISAFSVGTLRNGAAVSSVLVAIAPLG